MDRTRRPGAKAYDGDGITVSFEAALCLHAAECVRGLPEVFDVDRRPWISPGNAATDAVAEVVRRCPSGALQYHRTDDAPDEVADQPTQVLRHPTGAIGLRGDLELQTPDGPRVETRATLCGCGATARPPFCDHSGPCRPAT